MHHVLVRSKHKHVWLPRQSYVLRVQGAGYVLFRADLKVVDAIFLLRLRR